MPRFVLLYHDCPLHYARASHWDLMLEVGQSLRTWALMHLPREWRSAREQTAVAHPDCPQIAEEDAVPAEQLADHRLVYLEKEGPIGGDRGSVSRIDRGTYTSDAESPQCWPLTLAGENWSGEVTLRRTGPGISEWTLTVGLSKD